MVDISVEADVKEAQKFLTNLEKRQIPYASQRALNDVAFQVQKDLKQDMPRFIDRPTPFTLRAFAVKKATKLYLVASVYIRDIQRRYLKYQVRGGTRTAPLLTTPVNQATNKYGNIPGLRRKKPLWAQGDVTEKKSFIAEIKGTKGVWKKVGDRLQLVVAFIRRATYRGRFPMMKLAEMSVSKHFGPAFAKWIKIAIRTAK